MTGARLHCLQITREPTPTGIVGVPNLSLPSLALPVSALPHGPTVSAPGRATRMPGKASHRRAVHRADASNLPRDKQPPSSRAPPMLQTFLEGGCRCAGGL